MLETPKALDTEVRYTIGIGDNSRDATMGNQQERSLSWFAGILEGEGSISVQVYTLKDGRVRLTPYVCIVNSDRAILSEARRVFDTLTKGEKSNARLCKAGKVNQQCWNLRVDGEACLPVLKAVLPRMIGAKRKNAEVVIKYIEGRKNGLMMHDSTGRLQRVGYSHAEIDLICSIRSHARAKSSETIRRAPNVLSGDEIVRTATKFAERGRNDRAA